jgi:hypothetical protein
MRKQLTLAAVAALAAGTMGWMGSSHWSFGDEPQPGQGMGQMMQGMQTGAANLPAGILPKTGQEGDVKGIRETLSGATDAAYSKGGYGDLLDHFSKADRERLKQYAKENKEKMTVLDGRIAQIQKAWKAKYHQNFSLRGKEEVAFGPEYREFVVVQGEVVNPALLSNWPMTPTGNQPQPPMAPGMTQIEKGKNVAIVTFPSEHGMPELNVSLIQESERHWKIDVPDSLSGQQLYDQLLNQLTTFGEHANQWPDDVNQAYRTASHHTFMACYNVSLPPAGGMLHEGP